MGLMILAGVVIVLLVFLALFVACHLAVLPGRIARKRGHPQANAVQVAGVIGLVTGILWPFALVWAYYEYPSSGEAGAAGTVGGHASSVSANVYAATDHGDPA
jgi:hypothetical protein